MLPRFDRHAARVIAALVLGTINAAGEPSEGGSVAKSLAKNDSEAKSGGRQRAKCSDEKCPYADMFAQVRLRI
ncbi:MAG: hypothetical protein ACRDQA_31415 [Nocardioidaceae bacterium]